MDSPAALLAAALSEMRRNDFPAGIVTLFVLKALFDKSHVVSAAVTVDLGEAHVVVIARCGEVSCCLLKPELTLASCLCMAFKSVSIKSLMLLLHGESCVRVH